MIHLSQFGIRSACGASGRRTTNVESVTCPKCRSRLVVEELAPIRADIRASEIERRSKGLAQRVLALVGEELVDTRRAAAGLLRLIAREPFEAPRAPVWALEVTSPDGDYFELYASEAAAEAAGLAVVADELGRRSVSQKDAAAMWANRTHSADPRWPSSIHVEVSTPEIRD